MTTPTREAIQTFMSITGASESLASQKLEEYGGNLNEAVSGHFLEVERNIAISAQPISSQYEPVEMNSRSGGRGSGILPLLSSVRSFRPSLLLDPNYRRNFFNQIGGSSMNNRVEYNSGNENQHLLGPRHPIEHSTGTLPYYDTGINHNVLQTNDLHLNNNAAESEMMQAAIKASKRDFNDALLQRQHDSSNRWIHEEEEEEELAHALSLSLKTAEEEKAIRGAMTESECEQSGPLLRRRIETASDNLKVGSSSIQLSDPVSRNNLQNSKDSLHSHEWGDISTEELDAAIMLERQLFSQISEGSSYHSPQVPCRPSGPDRIEGPGPEAAPTSNLSSSTLMEQRLLREQQDNEYRASLLADREKELNARKEAEINSLAYQRKKIESEKYEKPLVAKDISLPPEPATDDENAVTLLVRMPDGSRHSRRFRKSDKLQLLFDFIDFGKLMKPGAYRVVRPYPRCAFSVDDGSSSLNELGLTSKQEALFLEPM